MDQSRLASLLTTLYSSQDNASIQDASEQLNKWQQHPDTWSQVDQLLSTPGLQVEFYYFFAQTLKTKIQYDMYQLPPTTFLALRDSLIQKLVSLASSSVAKPARKQLCLAIADLSIQAVEVWNTALPDLVNLLHSEHPVELFEILKLIPEETENMKLMTENGKRNLSRQKCLEYYFSVLELLGSVFQKPINAELSQSVMGCFLAWLKFDSPPIQYSLADSPILNHCVRSLSDVVEGNLEIEETSIEILTGIVETASSHRQRNHHNPLIELKIFPAVSAVCKTLLRTDLARTLHADEETLKALSRLVVATARGMMHAIIHRISEDTGIQEMVMLMIRLLGLSHLDISEMMCPFFDDFLAETVSPGHPQSSPVHDRLFETVIARIDVSTESSFNANDPFDSVDSDFLYFRNHDLCPLVANLCRDFYGKSAGAEKLLRGLIDHMVNPSGSETVREGFAFVLKDQLQNIREPSASLCEAVDFLIDSIQTWIAADSIHSCSLLDAFKRRSLLALVGGLGSWVRTEAQLFGVIDAVAQVLIRPSVSHSSLHAAAATSFRELCFSSHCRSMIIRNAAAVESVTKLFNQTVGHLAMREHSQVTEGVTSVLSACENDDIFNNLMRNMILLPLVQSVESSRCAKDVSNCGLMVDRLMGVMRSMSKLRPGSSRYNMMSDVVVNVIWTPLGRAMEDFRSDSEFIEKTCRLLKHTLRCVPDVFKQILSPVGRLLVRDFSIAQHSSYLYTAEVLAHEFGQDSNVRGTLSELFSSLASEGVRIAHQRIASTPQFGQDTVDELIEDLYGMIERFIRHSPTIVVQARQALQAVISLLIPVLSRIRRSETIEAVSAFTEQLFAGEWTHGVDIGTVSNDDVLAIKRCLFEIAPSLVQELFSLLISVCSRAMRQAIPSILMTVNNFDHEAFKNQWVIRGLQLVPLNIMTDRDKQDAVAALCSLDDDRAVNNCVQDILYRAELVGRRVRNELQ